MILSYILADSRANREKIVDIVKQGQCAVLPTETVYGLAGNALDDKAVANIFAIKNRPTFNPLIIHGLNREFLEPYVKFHHMARRLADRYWPGPLTIILPKRETSVSPLASAGLSTLAVRVPNNESFRDIIEMCQFPLAAPSANPSNYLSATTAEDVHEGFQVCNKLLKTEQNFEVPILEGGECSVGLESTVVDATNPEFVRILRPGFITEEELKFHGFKVLSEGSEKEGKAILSPGQLSRHYSPLFPLEMDKAEPQKNQAWLCFGPQSFSHQNITLNLSPKGDIIEAAAHLFHYLHILEKEYLSPKKPFESVAIQVLPQVGLGMAIRDRLTRAQGQDIVDK